jgi:hypothetical protein
MDEIARCERPDDASTLEIAAAIREYAAALKAAKPTVKVINEIVCPKCRVKAPEELAVPKRQFLSDLLYETRTKHAIGDDVKLNGKGSRRVSEMKREFCLGARKANYSYPQIARFLGMNHTSVMHLVKKA